MTRTLILNGGATVSQDLRSAYLAFDDPLARFEKTGINTGDTLVFDSILRETVHDEIVNLQFDAAHDPKCWPEGKFDLAIIRGSNYLHENMDLTGVCAFLETLDCPIIAIGVGAQAAKPEMLKINEGSKRFWQIVADHSSSLGVRGAFSAEAFEDIGIKNLSVIGCPSFFRSLQPRLKIKQVAAFPRFGINLNRNLGGRYSSNIIKSNRLQRHLITQAAKLPDTFVYTQGEAEETRVNFLPDAEKAALARTILEQYSLGKSTKAMALFEEQLVTLFKVSQWQDHIRDHIDFMVGFRLHGCAIALAQGIPSVLFVYDTRTREIASLFNIPAFEVERFQPFDLDEITQKADFAPFEAAYIRNFSAYRDFLEKNGVAHRLSGENAQNDGEHLIKKRNLVRSTYSPAEKNRWLQKEFTHLSKQHIKLKKASWRQGKAAKKA